MHLTASAKFLGSFIKLMFPRTPNILFQMVHADSNVHPGLAHSGALLSVTSSETVTLSFKSEKFDITIFILNDSL